MATTDTQETLTDHELADKLLDLLTGAVDPLDDDELFERVDHVGTFADQGVMTLNAGLVVRLADGSEFQLTVVRSR